MEINLNNNIDNLEITNRIEHAKKHHKIYAQSIVLTAVLNSKIIEIKDV